MNRKCSKTCNFIKKGFKRLGYTLNTYCHVTNVCFDKMVQLSDISLPDTKPRRWLSGLARSPRKRKAGCLKPSRDGPRSLKQAVTAW